MVNVAILISGRGSNLKAILDNIKTGYLSMITVKIVVADRKCPGLQYARDFGIPYKIIYAYGGGKTSVSNLMFDEELVKLLTSYKIDLVCMAGFKRVLTPFFIKKFMNKVLNIHPSLLPAFANTLHAQREALEYGVKITGCTVHIATDTVDGGPILVQHAVRINSGDTEKVLSDNILAVEHVIYSEAIKLWSEKNEVFYR